MNDSGSSGSLVRPSQRPDLVDTSPEEPRKLPGLINLRKYGGRRRESIKIAQPESEGSDSSLRGPTEADMAIESDEELVAAALAKGFKPKGSGRPNNFIPNRKSSRGRKSSIARPRMSETELNTSDERMEAVKRIDLKRLAAKNKGLKLMVVPPKRAKRAAATAKVVTKENETPSSSSTEDDGKTPKRDWKLKKLTAPVFKKMSFIDAAVSSPDVDRTMNSEPSAPNRKTISRSRESNASALSQQTNKIYAEAREILSQSKSQSALGMQSSSSTRASGMQLQSSGLEENVPDMSEEPLAQDLKKTRSSRSQEFSTASRKNSKTYAEKRGKLSQSRSQSALGMQSISSTRESGMQLQSSSLEENIPDFSGASGQISEIREPEVSIHEIINTTEKTQTQNKKPKKSTKAKVTKKSPAWNLRHPFMQGPGKCFYNKNLVSESMLQEALTAYAPTLKLSKVEKKKYHMQINRYIEKIFNQLCDNTPLFYGVWTYSQMIHKMKEEGLMDPNTTPADFRNYLKETVGAKEAKTGEGIIYPKIGETDTLDFYNQPL